MANVNNWWNKYTVTVKNMAGDKSVGQLQVWVRSGAQETDKNNKSYCSKQDLNSQPMDVNPVL